MKTSQTKRTRSGLAPGFAVLMLSGLWAIAWLRTDLVQHFGNETLPSAQSQAALFAIFTVLAASLALARRVHFPRGRQAWACAGIGIGLFIVPAALAYFAQRWVSRLDAVAVFSLTPVFAVVLEPHLQGSALQQGKGALLGALASVAGVLCLFPLDIPGSFRAAVALCALLAAAFAVAATNCLAVSLAQNFAGRSILPMAVLAAATSSTCFAVAAIFTSGNALHWSALTAQLPALLIIDLPALFLLFWLMPRIAASRMTTRFLFAPLIAILASVALAPAPPPVRAWIGLALLATGGGWLLFAPDETEE